MRIVEFVGVVVATLAAIAWLIGKPHTVESVRRERANAAPPHEDDTHP